MINQLLSIAHAPYLTRIWKILNLQHSLILKSQYRKEVWLGNVENHEWRELKEEIKAERGAKCSVCGCTKHLDLHHMKARRTGGTDVKDNLQLLCRNCHAQTSSFGDHSRLQ
ncbi:MAG: HNH endonuclease signature motif containing protein [Cyanobacteria bacterium J06632_19]